MAKRRGLTQGPVRHIIAIGYDLTAQKGGVLFFRVGVLAKTNAKDWTDLLNTMAEIEYNDFNGHNVAQMLAFRAEDGQLSLVEFGREHSPVLYLHFENARQPALAAGEDSAIERFIEEIGVEFDIKPDEVSWDANRRCLRLWWD